ncbi:beta/gamma crystallin domain-containing protein [Kineosporia babensis]|uniref:Streptomyces killer toxin-like beta/gamma crystallin domain-containing protein n=1 Tax=Kineosporia babensis TaxID=499548 RepID=A0A9X1SSF2_9ACTN|nr:hypothetical protein [Kineosporia babensis]MCD5310226.1 hypothetical protein [Kineosporia babensis]
MITRTRAALGSAAIAAIAAAGTVATAVPALAIDSPPCSDSGASGYVRVMNDPDGDGVHTAVQCFANAGTWNGSIPGIAGVETGVNRTSITYNDDDGQHTVDLPDGADSQLGDGSVEVVSVTIH